MLNEFEFCAPQGWQCPICKRVYSPTTPMCLYCGGESKTHTTTTTTGDPVSIRYPNVTTAYKGHLQLEI